MNNPAGLEQSSAQELYFLYELAKVFSSSLELSEVAEYILDGACALMGTEQGLLCVLEAPGEASAGAELVSDEGKPAAPPPASQLVLRQLLLRNLSLAALEALAPCLEPVWASRQVARQSQRVAEADTWQELIAAPLIVRDQVQGVLGVLTTSARMFTPREQERLASVASLAALALENARLHDQIQREVQMLRRLVQAARQMGEGQLSAEQIAGLENSAGWDEISRLSQAFAQMARQVIQREERLNQKVRELEIVIDAAKRDRQIAEITETDYFRRIQEKAGELRKKRSRR
jgi:transcriptional regulator with GAF, ATPase, and Fis domain